jgi:peroxiredoxin
MKSNSLIVGAAAFAALFSFTANAQIQVGQPAPDFALTDINGRTHKLSDYRGKVVVIEWVNSGCPIVKAHYDAKNMQDTQKFAAEHGAVWLQINTSAPGAQGNLSDKAAADWQKKTGVVATAYLKDPTGKTGRLYHAQTTPHMYVVNKEGTLAYQGAIDSGNSRDIPTATNYIKAALASLKDGKPIEKHTTKAYGCAIKYPKAGT